MKRGEYARQRKNQAVEADEETINKRRKSLTTNMKEAMAQKCRIIETIRKEEERFKNW